MVSVAVIGDRLESSEPQNAIDPALRHAARSLGVDIDVEWLGTPKLEAAAAELLAGADAVWCAPGSPFLSMEGALAGITVARTTGVPFLGTCAGFQHGVIEFAREVLGMDRAHHAEYGPSPSSQLIIDELACSLVGQVMTVDLKDPAMIEAYGSGRATERYHCRFGLDETYRPALEAAGLCIAGVDAADGSTRILTLADHRFFVLTLFVPQVRVDHPLVRAFVAAAV